MYYPVLNLVFDEDDLLSFSVSIRDGYTSEDVFELTQTIQIPSALEETVSMFFDFVDILLDQYADGYEHGIIDATEEDE